MNPIQIKHTNLDLDQLTRDARRISNKVVKQFNNEIFKKLEESWARSYEIKLAEQLYEAPITSRLHDYYNVFSFPYDGINALYREVISFFKEVNPYTELYYMHAWLNYQYKGQSIPWHHHWKGLTGLDKTFVCSCYINAEPSITTYKFPDYTYEMINKNNTITMYEDIGDIHMVDTWNGDDPRITISMDFVPMKYIQGSSFLMNTWMPIV